MFLFGLSRFFAFVLMIWCRFIVFAFTTLLNFVCNETVDDGVDDVSECSFEVIRTSENSSVVDDVSENLDVDASEESLVVASSSDDTGSDFTSCEYCSTGRVLRDAHHYPFCSQCVRLGRWCSSNFDASEESSVVASSSDDTDSDVTSCEFCSKGRLFRDAHHYLFCSDCWYNQF